MKTREIKVLNRKTGKSVRATQCVCETCDGTQFFIFMPADTDHDHYQCVGCNETYCDGCQGTEKGGES